MHNILKQLHSDHINYSKLLTLLKNHISNMQNGDDPDFHEMYSIMKYMVNFPDIFHHPFEEVLFRQFTTSHGEKTELIEKTSYEHRILSELGQKLINELQIVISGNVTSRQLIMDTAEEYLNMMHAHMDTEESKVFPLIDEKLSSEDWALVEAQIEHVKDPIFGDVISREFKQLYEAITE